MSNEFCLRPASKSDNAQLQEWVQGREDYSAFPLPLKQQLEETQWRGWCAGVRDQPGASTWIVCAGPKMLGLLVLKRGDVVRILDVIVAAAERNRGVGTWVLGTLQAEGVTLELQVQKQSPARRLYEREGFVVHAEDALNVHMRWFTST